MDILNQVISLSCFVREKVPLIHNITNYVTVNDCANAILAVGGSPIMADDRREAAEVTRISDALVINIGTLNERCVGSMMDSGKVANTIGIPVVFDPVGAGATTFRNETALSIATELDIALMRGNLSEISFLAGCGSVTRGVDVNAWESMDAVAVAIKAAKKFQCVVAVTGAVDVISDGERVVKLSNGIDKMAKVTGTGCMTSAIAGAYSAFCEDAFISAVSAVLFMGIAGQIAWNENGHRGTGSFHIGIIDALSRLEENTIREMAKIEVVR